MRLHQLHIPRTGGTALAHALSPYQWIQRDGHPFRLSMLGPDDLAITIVRDPVARYQSAVAWAARHPDEPTDEVFRPQSWWLDGDLSRLLWVGRTETLDEDAEHLFLMLGIEATLPVAGPERNASPEPHPPMSPEAEAFIRVHYAEDYSLLSAI